MNVKWMNKNYFFSKLIYIPIYFIIFFCIKHYKTINQKQIESISAVGLEEGAYPVFDEKQENCGFINIKKNMQNGIIISINGNEIFGVLPENKQYKNEAISYSNIYMFPKTVMYETFYSCDTGDSFIVIFKIRKKNYYFIPNLKKQKNKDLYMFCEFTYEEYNYMLDGISDMELQTRSNVRKDYNRYTCFFIP